MNINSIHFKNEEHKAFAIIYSKACIIMATTSYHDDSGCWCEITSKEIYSNEYFTMIYQPKKKN